MFLGLFGIVFVFANCECVLPVVEVERDINIALLLNNCRRNDSEAIPFDKQSLVSTALWTIERINYFESLAPLKLGLQVYEICTEQDALKFYFQLYENRDSYVLGTVNEKKLSTKLNKFADLLEIPTVAVTHLLDVLIKAANEFMRGVNWTENVTVFAPDKALMSQYFKLSKSASICVKECYIYETTCNKIYNDSDPLVFFGNAEQIEQFIENNDFTYPEDIVNILFVPIDGSVPKDLPHNSFVISPQHNPAAKEYKISETILPSPVFLYVARAILTLTENAKDFMEKNCEEPIYSAKCLKNKFPSRLKPVIMTTTGILDTLKIEELKKYFVYDIYRVDNDTTTKSIFLETLSKIFSYNIFYNNLTLVNYNFDANSSYTNFDGNEECVNYFRENHLDVFFATFVNFSFRSEAWVYAFLSLSLLGVIVCMSILIFLLVSICRRDLLEGNPVLTISLLVAVTFLFCSVLPFSLESNKNMMHSLCLIKSLSITLGYAMVFSLLLSRCILLATASKETGFMSHIAGPVQSFLTLFIFGVQVALSLQVVGKCYEIFYSTSFVYVMSYNIMLLLLLLCLCPLIYKCDRNYREGKYFCIAIALVVIAWAIWLSLFLFLDNSWNEPLLCFGLVSTAGGFLGAVFIPRTYLMTIAAARNKITSNLPTMSSSNSIMDIYRSNTQ
ncbi:unnamed protein product [Phyllotreta striolata]|nr:unnamed protein product [Phyllotreta striolata]